MELVRNEMNMWWWLRLFYSEPHLEIILPNKTLIFQCNTINFCIHPVKEYVYTWDYHVFNTARNCAISKQCCTGAVVCQRHHPQFVGKVGSDEKQLSAGLTYRPRWARELQWAIG